MCFRLLLSVCESVVVCCCVQVTRNMMKASLALPPGDIYNLTVTACTERSRNTSVPHIMKLGVYHTHTNTKDDDMRENPQLVFELLK